MAKHNNNWSDDYWLLLMQLYLRRPVGVKPLYSRQLVDLSLELHIPPEALHARMRAIATLATPRIERLRQTCSASPRRLARAVRLLRAMNGFNSAGGFYEGVETAETFERDFRPVFPDTPLTPVMLILILDLYFRLTPLTMVEHTPEVVELARLMGISAREVVHVMDIYQCCDPCLKRSGVVFSPLLLPCRDVWQRFGNGDPGELAVLAGELREYFAG